MLFDFEQIHFVVWTNTGRCWTRGKGIFVTGTTSQGGLGRRRHSPPPTSDRVSPISFLHTLLAVFVFVLYLYFNPGVYLCRPALSLSHLWSTFPFSFSANPETPFQHSPSHWPKVIHLNVAHWPISGRNLQDNILEPRQHELAEAAVSYSRGRCRKHFFQILSRYMFFFVFLNFKRGFYSWTFWFGASFICKNAHLCLHADLHGEVGQNILNGQTNMLTRRTSDFSVTYHLQIPRLLL